MATPKNIYHLFLDRFAGPIANDAEPAFAGGTLAGVTNKLSYIKDLGFNSIWLSPFYQSAAYHGYHITDFYKVDPHFGTEHDLDLLLARAHSLGMEVYADFVPNHLSIHHPYFKDALQNKRSNYRNWFFFMQWPDKYLTFLQFCEIPKINLDHPDARKYIIDAALFWADKGLDGFRIDHAIGPSLSYSQEFYKTLKTNFPNIYLFAELWAEGISRSMFRTINPPRKFWKYLWGIDQAKLQLDYSRYFDGVLDFYTQSLIHEAILNQASINQAIKKINNYHNKFIAGYEPICFLDNHDMDRFLYQCNNDKNKLKKGLSILSELRSTIAIYYGTESGMQQSESIRTGKPHADINVRKMMNWNSIDQEMMQFVTRLLNKRNHPENSQV